MTADSDTPDCVLYVLEASKSNTNSALNILDDDELAAAAQVLKHAKKAIVLIKKMYVFPLVFRIFPP